MQAKPMSGRGKQARQEAVAYLRTSSAANVGTDKDSETRQRAAILAFAKREGFEVVAEFLRRRRVRRRPHRDPARLLGPAGPHRRQRRARRRLVEEASRFARQLVVQEAGVLALVERGVRVLTASGDDLTETEDRTASPCARSPECSRSSRRLGWCRSCDAGA